MKKTKIAISLDKALLVEIDSRVDGQVLRSRSQAIEVFLRKGLYESEATQAVILLKGEHQKHALSNIDGKHLILRQIELLSANGIEEVFILTQRTEINKKLLNVISKAKLPVSVIEDEGGGNAIALQKIQKRLTKPFVVIAGDTYTELDLAKMIRKLLSSSQVASMGLMTRNRPGLYGIAHVDGDLIVSFDEKPHHSDSFVVNAGVYVFKPEVFDSLAEGTLSLERGLFPILAKKRLLLGFFTHGRYVHVAEDNDMQKDIR